MPRKKSGRSSDKLAMENATKTLLANIRFASIDNPIKTLTITSTQSNEGKSTVAYNLAIASATSGRRTAIVECDMRRRSLAGMIGIHGARGLYAVLSGEATIRDIALTTKTEGLDFIGVEPGIPSPPDVIASKHFHRFVRDLRSQYDLVIFDTPPVGGFVDAAELGSITDGTLFVLRENYTRREEAAEALEQLRKAGANVLGTVLNFCEHESNGYYDYYHEPAQGMPVPKELPREELASPSPRFSRKGAARGKDASIAASKTSEKTDRASDSSDGQKGREVSSETPRTASSPSETGSFLITAQTAAAARKDGSIGRHTHEAHESSEPVGSGRVQPPIQPVSPRGIRQHGRQATTQPSSNPYSSDKNPCTR